jgi:hypothetical protein
MERADINAAILATLRARPQGFMIYYSALLVAPSALSEVSRHAAPLG